MKFNDTFIRMVKKDLKSNHIPFLVGEAGIGKSSWVEDLAKDMGTQVFLLACNQLGEKTDLTGCRTVPIGERNGKTVYAQEFFPHLTIMQCIEYAEDHPSETPILFMDEINRTTPDVTSAALSIATARVIGTYHLPSNVRIMCAGNNRGNITSLDDASVTRFVMYDTAPDLETFLSVNPDLHPLIRSTLLKHPETLICLLNLVAVADDQGNSGGDEASIDDYLDQNDQMVQSTRPRTVTYLSEWLNQYTPQEMIQDFTDIYTTPEGVETNALEEGIVAHVGRTEFTAQLMAEISQNINTMATNAQRMTLQKPLHFDELKSCGDMTSLTAKVNTLNNDDRSACLLYALYDTTSPNDAVIAALAPTVPAWSQSDTQNFTTLANAQQLAPEHVEAFLNTGAPISNAWAAFLQSIY